MRPTQYCKRCGEYVAEQFVARPSRVDPRSLRTIKALVHIDADGNRIDRAHMAELEGS